MYILQMHLVHYSLLFILNLFWMLLLFRGSRFFFQHTKGQGLSWKILLNTSIFFVIFSGLLSAIYFVSSRNIFHAINVLASQLFFGLPIWFGILGCYNLLCTPKGAWHKNWRGILPLLGAGAIFLFAWYAYIFEPHNLKISHYTFTSPKLRGLTHEITIVQFSDLQPMYIGKYEEWAVTQALALKPDLILLTGDFYTLERFEFKEKLPQFRQLYSRFQAPYGVYAVNGNMDYFDWQLLFESSQITTLPNKYIDLPIHGSTLRLMGFDYYSIYAEDRQTIKGVLPPQGDSVYTLGVTHTPDTLFYLPEGYTFDLMVAGHTHGGQVVFPFIGALISFSEFRGKEVSGLLQVHNTPLLISRGVGTEGGVAPKIRILCPPEIIVIHLKADEEIRSESPL